MLEDDVQMLSSVVDGPSFGEFDSDSFWRPVKLTPVPGPVSRRMRAVSSRCLNAGTDQQTLVPFVQDHKRQGVIVDVDGNEYVDGICAWGAEPWGVADLEIRAAMMNAWDVQGAQLSCSILTPEAIRLAERLIALAPASITRAEFSVTGTQAVESAVRLMRAATGRGVILVFGPVYHGESTSLTAAMSSDGARSSRGAHVFAPGIVHIPYPCQAGSPFRPGESGNAEDVLHYLAWVLEHQVAPDQVAGVVIEPVATEGGVFAPSQEFWNSLGALCVKHGWVLCLDEVQTGMGRCGSVLAVDLWEGIEPDLVILGKGLSGGGMPISAILGSDRVMAGSQLSQGSTFGWQPAACAAALASIDILTRPGVLEYVRWMGGEALRILSPLVSLDHVVGARAFGAEVVLGYQLLMPDGLNRSVFLHEYLLEHGVVAMCDEEKPFVRLQPALNLNRDLWRYALHTLADAVTSSG